MKFIITILIFSSFSLFPKEKVQVLKAKVLRLDFSSKSIKKLNTKESFIKCNLLLKKLDSEKRDYSKLTDDEKKTLSYCNKARKTIWNIQGRRKVACRWYCMGEAKKVIASSFLKSANKDKLYQAENIHDFNYKTVWIEGKKGIGEYIEYHFVANSPRINKITVVNGYVETKEKYKNNSRAKKILLYVNNKAYAILNLEDTISEQVFSLNLLGKPQSNLDWVLKFEILEVYKGLKHKNVVISEIYFDNSGPN